MRSRIGVLAGLAFLFAATLPAAPTHAADNPCYKWSREEQTLANKLNDSRANNNLRSLKLDPELSKVATVQSRRMADQRRIFHQTYEQLSDSVTHWSILGEAVSRAQTINSVHRKIMRQPEHRYLALHSSMRYMGVGITWQKPYWYASVVFEGSDNPGTRLPMPDCR